MNAYSTSMLGVSARQRAAEPSLSGLAYQRIKEKIVLLELPPASVLDEAVLAADLELGLTPIRQALRQLAYENLVVILPRRGTLVADLNPADLQKIFEMRVEMEALAARLAAQRASADELAAMEAHCTRCRLLIDEGDRQQLIELDYRFHLSLWQAAHNEFLEETLARLYSHVLRLWNVSLQQVSGLRQALREHVALVERIACQDDEGAAAIMRRHVSHFQQEMMRVQ